MKKTLIGVCVAVAAVVAVHGGAAAANTTVVVTSSNVATVFPNETHNATSSYSFVTGPATPPLGSGSLELTTTDTSGHQQFMENQQQGILLSSITAMGYSTYRHSSSASGSDDPSINLETCLGGFNGTCQEYTTLVFEPVYNPTQGVVTDDTWQSWDAYDGGNAIWWSTHTVGPLSPTTYSSWDAIITAFPNAIVIDYGVNQGSGNAGLTADTDQLQIATSGGTTTYDFEPTPTITLPEVPSAALLVLALPVAGGAYALKRRLAGRSS